ncbi:hypothetical protein R3P38DRAFT_2818543 [Favolaschia claudopus]|uniref:Uncharacterized protein n=1 Tax=Favolaschia claudopus TaxID=2862362 RepID=A0AAW0EFD5_9AGAR
MRLSFPSSGRRPLFPTAKIKTKLRSISSQASSTLPEVALTALHVLAESADAFPPLKSAVGGVRALCHIAQRAKHFKSDAIAVALRSKQVLDTIADAVPDGSQIPQPMLQSIDRFTLLLDDVRLEMEELARTGMVSRLLHVDRNEQTLGNIRSRLDNAYQDFLAASALRVEVQQTQLVLIQSQLVEKQDEVVQRQDLTLDAVKDAIQVTKTIQLDISEFIYHSRLLVFLARP